MDQLPDPTWRSNITVEMNGLGWVEAVRQKKKRPLRRRLVVDPSRFELLTPTVSISFSTAFFGFLRLDKMC